MVTHEQVEPTTFSSSRRERRLWLWTLMAVLGVYSTLGLGSALVEVGQSVYAFVAGMLLFVATVLALGLRIRPRGMEVGIALGVVVVYLLVLARMTLPERSHLIEYGVVAAFAYEALLERASQGRRVPVPALLAIGVTAVIGAIDEGVQLFIPDRVFDPVDILFNFLAASMAVVSIVVLRWARRVADRMLHRTE